MAVFKPLRVKSKDYIFKYEGNETLSEPARVVFARFPRLEEYFFRSSVAENYRDIDFTKLGQKDDKEIEKLFSVFITKYIGDMVDSGGASLVFHKVDLPAFLRECVDHFENLEAPWWVLQLQSAFDQAYGEIEAYQVRKSMRGGNARSKMMMDDNG